MSHQLLLLLLVWSQYLLLSTLMCFPNCSVCFLIGLLSASFIAQTLVILNKARSTTTWILAIPIISYIFSIISDTLKGLNTKTIIVLNNIFKYIDFLSFYSIDLEATNISNIAEIDFLHMTIIFIISTILLVVLKFRNDLVRYKSR